MEGTAWGPRRGSPSHWQQEKLGWQPAEGQWREVQRPRRLRVSDK